MGILRRAITKTICRILILAILHLCWLTSYGWAEMVETEPVTQSQVQKERQRILDLLNRQKVAGELEKYGVSRVEAVARINSLSDEELAQISGKIEEFKVGGQTGGWGDSFAVLVLVIIFFPLFIFIFLSAKDTSSRDVSSTSENFDPAPVNSCLGTCYSNFSDCMNSSDNSTEENACYERQNTCTQHCEASFN